MYGPSLANCGSSNSAVLVTGAGSVWSNGGDLVIGDLGSGNNLTITNGGQVVDAHGYIGWDINASNNASTSTSPSS